MRVLVTGATGFIGAWSARAIADAGHDLRVLVRDEKRVAQNLLPLSRGQLEIVVGDMTDDDAVTRALDGSDAVLHAAAVVSTQRRRAAEMLDANRRGAELVLGGAAERGLDPIVHVSSVSALFQAGLPMLTADLPIAPATSAYGRSKAEADRYARTLQDAGAPVVITYPGGVIGPPAGTALGESVESVRQHLSIGALPVRTASLSWIDVRDVAAVHAAVLQPGRGPRRYMCGGRRFSMSSLSDLYRDVTGRQLPVVAVPGRALRMAGFLVDALSHVVPFDTFFSHEAAVYYTSFPPTDDRAVTNELGVGWRDPHDTLGAAVRGLYELGRISAAQAGSVAS